MMKIISTLSFYFFISSLAMACVKSGESLSEKKGGQNSLSDTLGVAQFPGGVEAMQKYINENLNWKQGSLTTVGTVFVSCIVNETGELRGITIEKSLCDSCDTAAVQMVRSMPPWVPVKINGKFVESKVLIPVRFGLYSDK